MSSDYQEDHFTLKRQGLALSLTVLLLFMSAGGPGTPAITAFGSATAQTGAIPTLVAYNNTGADRVYSIGGDLDVTSLTLGTVTLSVTWTDWNGGSQSFTLATGNGVAPFPANTVTLMSRASTNVTLRTTATAFSGTYNVAGYIMLIR